MKTPDETVPTAYDEPHEVIGRFVVLCSMLDYRLSQLLSRWFSQGSRLKFLSNVIHNIDPERKLEIIAERLSLHHPAGAAVARLMGEIEPVLRRRDLAVHGVLTGLSGGRHGLKNLAAHRALDPGEEGEVLPVEEIPAWSQEAMRLTAEVVKLSQIPATRRGGLVAQG